MSIYIVAVISIYLVQRRGGGGSWCHGREGAKINYYSMLCCHKQSITLCKDYPTIERPSRPLNHYNNATPSFEVKLDLWANRLYPRLSTYMTSCESTTTSSSSATKGSSQYALQTGPAYLIPDTIDIGVTLLDVSHASKIIGQVRRCSSVTYPLL